MNRYKEQPYLLVAVAVFVLAAVFWRDTLDAAGNAAERKDGTRAPEPPWENSLGMRFVPVPRTQVLFSIWDTRIQDYQAFVGETRRDWRKPNFEQGPTHPAVNVSWIDAQAFCEWLTTKERNDGKITAAQSYRLPRDTEWSAAVGIDEAGLKQTHVRIRPKTALELSYPWGPGWPPPIATGNYDQSLAVDDYDRTSPVGSFSPNAFGLYDIVGNVWQWCDDVLSDRIIRMRDAAASVRTKEPRDTAATAVPSVSPPNQRMKDELSQALKAEQDWTVNEINGVGRGEWRLLRGGSYCRTAPMRGVIKTPLVEADLRQILRLSFRGDASPRLYDDSIGFRVVLAGPPPANTHH